jgi:hypothetical protein
MPDYGCFPLWEASPDAVGNIDPNTLPISANLASELDKWAAQFDATLNSEDPRESGFASSEHERDFADAGRQLCIKMQNELGPEFEVFLKI